MQIATIGFPQAMGIHHSSRHLAVSRARSSRQKSDNRDFGFGNARLSGVYGRCAAFLAIGLALAGNLSGRRLHLFVATGTSGGREFGGALAPLGKTLKDRNPTTFVSAADVRGERTESLPMTVLHVDSRLFAEWSERRFDLCGDHIGKAGVPSKDGQYHLGAAICGVCSAIFAE
jgi:hypothetical protein